MNLAASALPLAARADVDRARDILLRHGWNATCYQILNPGIELWFSQRDDAVIGFTRAPYRWVAAGGPICAEEALRRVVQEFEEDAARHHCGVCFVLAVERLRALVKEVGRHSVLTLGAQPVWSPADWIIRYGQNASLRSQVRRATRKGVRIDLPSIDQVRADDGCRAALAE
ncbi:MAG TPA: phosphatidylglycerol lysyltransferase domain-containing protein, partial [Tepidisphaeraceae bacterium]